MSSLELLLMGAAGGALAVMKQAP